MSGAATRYPMTSLPMRIVDDLQRPGSHAARADGGGGVRRGRGRRDRGVPRAARDGRGRRRRRAARRRQPAAPAASAAQTQQLEQYLAQQPRVPVMAPSDGAAVVIVKFNDYQCPPAADLPRLQAGPREVGQAGAGQGQVHHQGLSARARVQPVRRAGPAPGRVRSRGGGAAGARKGQGRGDGGLAVRQPAGDDSRHRQEGRGHGRRRHRLRRALSRHARAREGRHRAGRAAEGRRHADVLHERHAAARPARRVLRRGHRLGAAERL